MQRQVNTAALPGDRRRLSRRTLHTVKPGHSVTRTLRCGWQWWTKPPVPPAAGVNWGSTILGLIPPLTVPLIFVVAWWLIAR